MIAEVEAAVASHDKPNFAQSVLRASEIAFEHFIEHLAVRLTQMELGVQGSVDVDSLLTANQLAPVVDDVRIQFETISLSDSLSEAVNDRKIWVMYLHFHAMMGHETVMNETVAHTNLRKHNSEDLGRSNVTTSRSNVNTGGYATSSTLPPLSFAHNTNLPPLNPAALDLALRLNSLPLYPLHTRGHCPRSRSASMSFLSSLTSMSLVEGDLWYGRSEEVNDIEEGSGSDEENEGDYLEEEANDAEEGEEELDAEEMRLVDSSPAAPLLASQTIKHRLDNILRWLTVLKIDLRLHLRKDTFKIIRYLARRKHIYPTGVRKKQWVSTDTVAAMRAGVWTVAANDVSSGARSVPSLLFLHAIIMFLDKFGDRVTSWTDRVPCKQGVEGRYLS